MTALSATPGVIRSLATPSHPQVRPNLTLPATRERPGRHGAVGSTASRRDGRATQGHASVAGGPVQSPAGRAQSSPAMMKAAQDFEALAIGQLLQPMFDTVDTAHGLFGGGDAEAAWKPMLVDAIARQVAARGGLGLAAPVFHELMRFQETQTGTPQP